MKEVNDKGCSNPGTPRPIANYKVANQLECQQKCVEAPECVIISYIYDNPHSGRCQVCYIGNDAYRANGWSIYRKPKTPG